jgi:hypothetical protein
LEVALPQDLGHALGRLARFRADVQHAEQQGSIDKHVIEEAGALRMVLSDAGADQRTYDEAVALYDRAMRIKART